MISSLHVYLTKGWFHDMALKLKNWAFKFAIIIDSFILCFDLVVQTDVFFAEYLSSYQSKRAHILHQIVFRVYLSKVLLLKGYQTNLFYTFGIKTKKTGRQKNSFLSFTNLKWIYSWPNGIWLSIHNWKAIPTHIQTLL